LATPARAGMGRGWLLLPPVPPPLLLPASSSSMACTA
jgi:hypothetical protein